MSSRALAFRSVVRSFSQGAPAGGAGTSAPKGPGAAKPEAKGLSDAVVNPASGNVGPRVPSDKSGAYKVPEYFCYHTMSYHEAEIEMARYRLPQPSSLR